jgi:uncharacterized ubiquitin-like protein YukD
MTANETVVIINDNTKALFRPRLSITLPIIAPPIIYPIPNGIIAKSESSNFSLGDKSGFMVSVMIVTKLPAKVAKLSEHQIIPGIILIILLDISSLKVSEMLSLKDFSSSGISSILTG